MNNRIHPYGNLRLDAYRQIAQRSETRQADPGSTPGAAAQTAAPAVADRDGLSPVEQQMIDRYFPASEVMTLRVYGSNRSARTIHPGALGTRLDVSG